MRAIVFLIWGSAVRESARGRQFPAISETPGVPDLGHGVYAGGYGRQVCPKGTYALRCPGRARRENASSGCRPLDALDDPRATLSIGGAATRPNSPSTLEHFAKQVRGRADTK